MVYRAEEGTTVLGVVYSDLVMTGSDRATDLALEYPDLEKGQQALELVLVLV